MSDSVQVKLMFSDQTVDISDLYSIVYTDIHIGDPQPRYTFTEFEGSHGRRLVNDDLDAFPITLDFRVYTHDLNDLILAQTEIRELIFREPKYYFYYSKEPGKKYPVSVKNLEIKRSASFILTVSVEFSVDLGHAKSIATTLSNFDLAEEWQFSQGLVAEDFSYTHDTSRFVIYNAGDFTVDPRENYLKITVEGESDGEINIFNKTTGERFVYRKALYSHRGDVLSLDGVYPLINGIHCGIDTNHGLISLAPGENEIEIQNVSRVWSTWDFNFLYK